MVQFTTLSKENDDTLSSNSYNDCSKCSVVVKSSKTYVLEDFPDKRFCETCYNKYKGQKPKGLMFPELLQKHEEE